MQKLYWLLYIMNFTFPQSYGIRQLLTIGHDCLVPVDKHDSDKTFSPPLTPEAGSKVKYVNFAVTKSVVNISETLHADRSKIDIKHIKCDFSSNVSILPPW